MHSKEAFLQNEYISILHQLQPGQQPKWGKMDAQQMVEHMRDVFKLANGKIILPLVNTDPEKLEKARAFMLSDAPFKENTKVPVMPEEPRPHKYGSMQEAIDKTEIELNDFFKAFAASPGKSILNPIFGELNYEEQIHLLYKHSCHHLRQFGMVE
ncbi:MAG: hypothetical protein RLZZ28_742 [Bacteroidota bacterium]|jgi:hypothetical protein